MLVSSYTSKMSASESTHSEFRKTEKHFKNRAKQDRRAKVELPSLRLHGVVDLSRPTHGVDVVQDAGWWGSHDAPGSPCGGRDLKPVRLATGHTGWVLGEGALGIDSSAALNSSGCILVPGYLSEEAQLEQLEDALASYTLPPNPLSLTTHYDLPANLFELYAADSDVQIQPLHASTSSLPASPATPPISGSRKMIETAPASKLGYEQILAANKDSVGDSPSDKLKAGSAERLMKELRWANLGWVYKVSARSQAVKF